jgi:hypothetical protein
MSMWNEFDWFRPWSNSGILGTCNELYNSTKARHYLTGWATISVKRPIMIEWFMYGVFGKIKIALSLNAICSIYLWRQCSKDDFCTHGQASNWTKCTKKNWGYVVPFMPRRRRGAKEAHLQSVSTSAVEEGKCSTSHSGHFIPGK